MGRARKSDGWEVDVSKNGQNRESESVMEPLGGLIDAALEIATRRRETLVRLREALKAGDNANALRLAEALCGLDDEPKSHRTRKGVN